MQTPKQVATAKDQRRADRAERRKRRADESARVLLAGDGLLRLPEVLAVFPVSASTWWAGVASGRFPAGIKIGERCTAWRAACIRALIAGEFRPEGAK